MGGLLLRLRAHRCAKQYSYSTFCAGKQYLAYRLAVKDLHSPIGLFSMAAGLQVVSTGDLVLQATNIGVLRLHFNGPGIMVQHMVNGVLSRFHDLQHRVVSISRSSIDFVRLLSKLKDPCQTLLHLGHRIGTQYIDRLALTLSISELAGLPALERLKSHYRIGVSLVTANLYRHSQLASGLFKTVSTDAKRIDT